MQKMTKKQSTNILSFADLHYSPERKDECLKILDFVGECAKLKNIDFITISGDLQDKALINYQRSGLPALKNKLDELSNTAHIVMIYGTPSHDPPGSLEIFTTDRIHICRPGLPLIINNTIFYSFPGVLKNLVIKDNAEKANKEYNEGLKSLCLSYAAHRKENYNKFAVVLGHGIVKGGNTIDEKSVSNSEIFLIESDLSEINANAYLWGDIHKSIWFFKILGGYCGSFAQNWKELNYIPSFKHSRLSESKRIDNIYIDFIPERIKLKSKQNVLNNTIEKKRVWLEYDFNDSDKETFGLQNLLKLGAMPGSKVTVKPKKKEIIRSKEIIIAKTYREQFLLWKPNASKQELDVCDYLEKFSLETGNNFIKTKIQLLSTRIKGAKPFIDGIGKDEIFIEWDKFNDKMIGVTGPGGIGKSMLFDYASPFPELLTQGNSLISTFELSDSFLENRYIVNGNEIKLKIFIKPHLATPTAEYYIEINGRPEIECTKNKAPYAEYVNNVFGSPLIFALTVFNTQFYNNAHYNKLPINPDLITCDSRTLKNIIQKIACISREAAHNKAKELMKNTENNLIELLSKVKAFLEASKEFDDYDLKKEIESKKEEIKKCKKIIDKYNNEIERKADMSKKLFGIMTYSEIARQKSISISAEIKNLKAKKNIISIKCPNCGYIDEKSKDKIREIDTGIKKLEDDRKIVIDKINPDAKENFDNFIKMFEADKKNVQLMENEVKRLEIELKSTKDKYSIFIKYKDKIKEIKSRIKEFQRKKEIWKTMIESWGHKGIPAMLLENVIPEIEQEANDILKIYYPLLKIEILTLKKAYNNKKLIEQLHINMINCDNGKEKPINCASGEERDFILSALRYAFKIVTQRKTGKEYLFNFADEPGRHVSNGKIVDFWDMQESISNKLFYISHKHEAVNRMSEEIDLTRF